jgi:hypothetical protein
MKPVHLGKERNDETYKQPHERKPARSGPIVKAKRLVQERFQERDNL